MQIHHIIPQAEGGDGSYENGIPVCLDCHAEIESRSNMGRSFSSQELKLRRDRWFEIVRDRPEVIIRGSRNNETGPLEALLAELQYNKTALSGHRADGFPPPLTTQFERAIATNSLSALPNITSESVQTAYATMFRVRFHFEEMARMDRSGGSGGAYANAANARNQLREQLRESLPVVIENLQAALGHDTAD